MTSKDLEMLGFEKSDTIHFCMLGVCWDGDVYPITPGLAVVRKVSYPIKEVSWCMYDIDKDKLLYKVDDVEDIIIFLESHKRTLVDQMKSAEKNLLKAKKDLKKYTDVINKLKKSNDIK